MSSKIPSVLDLIESNRKETSNGREAEVAATVKQQEMMQKTGELTPVILKGPNGTSIPAFFSNAENAFLPEFEV